jgi:maltose O-acetyltransferase
LPDPRWTTDFSVMSRKWAFLINDVAASPYVSMPTRIRIMRRFGIESESDHIYPRCYFHTCNVWLGPGAILNHGVHIENVARVEVGPMTGLGVFTTVLTSTHELGPSENRLGEWTPQPVTFGAGCWIGARSLILPGVTIGDGCLVAAGSVVRDDCEPNGLYAGVPARRVKDLPA